MCSGYRAPTLELNSNYVSKDTLLFGLYNVSDVLWFKIYPIVGALFTASPEKRKESLFPTSFLTLLAAVASGANQALALFGVHKKLDYGDE